MSYNSQWTFSTGIYIYISQMCRVCVTYMFYFIMVYTCTCIYIYKVCKVSWRLVKWINVIGMILQWPSLWCYCSLFLCWRQSTQHARTSSKDLCRQSMWHSVTDIPPSTSRSPHLHFTLTNIQGLILALKIWSRSHSSPAVVACGAVCCVWVWGPRIAHTPPTISWPCAAPFMCRRPGEGGEEERGGMLAGSCIFSSLTRPHLC